MSEFGSKARARRLPRICLHTPSGRDYVRLSGRMIYLGEHGAPEVQARYDQEIQRWLVNGRKPRPVPEVCYEGYSIEHLVVDYLDWIDRRGRYRKHGAETTELPTIRTALRCLCEFGGKLSAEEFDKKALRRFQEHLIEKGSIALDGTRITLTRIGVNRKVRIVQKMIAWGNEEELISDAIAGSVRLVRPIRRGETMLTEPSKRRPVSNQDLERTLPYLSLEVATMVRIQRRTGMRPGEVCLMRWLDIDKTPIVIGDAACWTYRPSRFKTEHLGKDVSYPLDPACQTLLLSFESVQPTEFLFQPKRAELARRNRQRKLRKTKVQPSQLARAESRQQVICRRLGDRYTSGSYALAISRACAKVGIPRWTPHQLRHARITEIAHDPRFGALAASIAANHSSLSATERYIQRDQRVAYEVAVRATEKYVQAKP